jgi:hypothetical protein
MMRRTTRALFMAGVLVLPLGVAAPASAEVQRDTVVQEYPGDLPPEDRNIVCANDPAAPDFNSYQYWLISGRSVVEVSAVIAPSGDAKAIHAVGRFEDVTAVRSDDTAITPKTYEVEAFAVSHLVERGDGSSLSRMRIQGTIVDTATGQVVDLIDNATIDRGDGQEFLYNRGNCG